MPGLPLFDLTRFNAFFRFSRSQTSSIRCAVDAGLSASRFAVDGSIPSPDTFGASPLPVPGKDNCSPVFRRFPSMSRASYSPLPLTPSGDRSGLRHDVPMPIMPSADFCDAVREPRDSLSPEPQDTPQISRGKLDRLPRTTAGSTPRTFDGCGLRDHLPARPVRNASYPVLVHRLAHLLHASFRPHLAATPLRFANPSPPSGRVGDSHPQAVEHARHTKSGCGVCRNPLKFVARPRGFEPLAT